MLEGKRETAVVSVVVVGIVEGGVAACCAIDVAAAVDAVAAVVASPG